MFNKNNFLYTVIPINFESFMAGFVGRGLHQIQYGFFLYLFMSYVNKFDLWMCNICNFRFKKKKLFRANTIVVKFG